MILPETLRLHALYLDGHPDGVRADLSGCDLSGADLSGADLSDADLSGADLSGARLLDASALVDRLTAKVSRQSPPVTREDIYRAIVGSADPYNLEESVGIMHSRRVAAMVDRVYALIEGATP